MKSKLVIFSMSMALLYSGVSLAYEGYGSSTQQGTSEHGGMMKEAASYEESSPVEVGNKICPISGQDIASMGKGVKYEYEGKVYNFCCKMCIESFKKNPEKYIKIIEENMKKIKGSLGNEMSNEAGSY